MDRESYEEGHAHGYYQGYGRGFDDGFLRAKAESEMVEPWHGLGVTNE